MYEIPVSINICGEEFKIRNNGDFRVVLDCFSALDDETLSDRERVFASLIIFYEGIDTILDFDRFPDLKVAEMEMFKFFNCGQEESPGAASNYKLIDWRSDSQLISSAINQVAHKEIRAEAYIHWWTFMGYYLAVGECALSTVVNIRSKIAKGKKLEKYESAFRRDNPQYFNWNPRSLQQREADELVKELWNSGK